MAHSWVAAIRAAGAVPASHLPEASLGRTDLAEVAGGELVEEPALAVHPVEAGAAPPAVSFLDGIQLWQVTHYDGVVPIVRAYVAAATRRRGRERRLATTGQLTREFHVTHAAALRPGVRTALATSGLALVDIPAADAVQPGRALEAARRAIDAARVAVEKELGEACVGALAPDEWLVVDGLLSESGVLAGHARTLGVIKSHGAQYFEGTALERALTLPAGHRTSVFQPRGRARHEVYSWYLRLWPWEGNDLLFGLVRVEARAHRATVAGASATSGWLVRERAPVSTPDPRWDRLLYPLHDVETYLWSRAPRELLPISGSRLPRAAT
ncbi:MAG TPA: hypothetical protein VEU55_00835 [Gemmatimonadales bacterium]|nr:hypothetical protein [Gemmatimonadales bacterium]